ncbi:hypothetical protein DSM03_10569 [Leeuwenhoekiella aestuarii]|uniref:Uncharacterized protein n=1 Tax=Leeuwenhoekiella aestuarii TaxID=2249426 RepID=A0A4Q0NQC4_9FLAO|nr:hypothetical protein [Leeuwenhoekiella aestuarii]RXG12588.1 hypothetical protein DSM04_10669 [Leeuwenhoekiella aestuarii]RXG14535.1 hypothetical protein DSM03_10569 [Leeuwenhoekiella aestuarii]
MRKSFFIVFVCLFSYSLVLAQEEDQARLVNNPDQLLSVSNGVRNSYGSLRSIPPVTRVEGSPYLFDDWLHTARVYAKNGQLYMVENVNLDMQNQAFVTKVAKDSLFTFQFNEINFFEINGKKFESIFTKDGRRIYEIVSDNGEERLLKAYSVKLVPSSPDPMKNRPFDKYVQRENYYFEKDGKVSMLSLRKGKVLRTFDLEKNNQKTLEKFVEKNDLSYSDEKDVIKMIDFISTL